MGIEPFSHIFDFRQPLIVKYDDIDLSKWQTGDKFEEEAACEGTFQPKEEMSSWVDLVLCGQALSYSNITV